MNPVRVNEFLGQWGFQGPNLAVLAPNVDEYSVFASQPNGEIRVSAEGIGNRSQEDAIRKNTRLLQRAAERRVDLLITPEYSLPWRALIDSILAGHGPAEACLWALGCESITIAELGNLQSQLGSHATVLYEPLEQISTRNKTFLDPLAYVFVTLNAHAQHCTIILIQFKTHPSVDDGHMEIDHLIRGSSVYVFGTTGSTIRLASFICSDVLALDDQQIKDLYFASLILHIQLNPKPRESTYRAYRKPLFSYADHCTELICLNWAANICSWQEDGDTPAAWKNIGGSAWYLRPKKFDSSDLQITENHRRGLYYTWHNTFKCHILFFNYEPGIYCFVTTKVWHYAIPQVQSKQTGPRLQSILKWSDRASDWVAATTSGDGFHELISPWSGELVNLTQIYTQCPVATERLIALVHGNAHSIDWYSVKELTSFTVDESEHIRRITFAQETEPACVELREQQIQHFLTAQQAFQEFTNWPPELEDLKFGWKFAWVSQHLHCNVLSSAEKHATVVYCSDNVAEHRLRIIGDALREWLIRTGDSPSRLAILFRKNNQLCIWRHPESKRYDKPASDSPANFTEAT